MSKDRHTTFAEIYPPGQNTFSTTPRIKTVRAALQANAPPGVETNLDRAHAALRRLERRRVGGPSVLTEALIGGFGALIILLFVFGTLPAVAIPLVIALPSILNTFTLVWLLTYITDVSIIVQFLIALVGLGVAIDYALLMIFRFREELAHGEDVETALVETMTHAGRSVIVSGSTVAVGLLSMVLLPLPFIRSIGIGGMLIPAVSVIVVDHALAGTALVARPRINKLRVMPKRFVDRQRSRDRLVGPWAWFVVRRPLARGGRRARDRRRAARLGLQLNPSEAQAKDFPGAGRCDHRPCRRSRSAGISAGVIKPFIILTPTPKTGQVVQRRRAASTESPARLRRRLAEGRPSPSSRRSRLYDGSSKQVRGTISRVKDVSAGGCEPRRRRAGGPRLRACGLRELPVRPAVRDPADLHPAGARVPLAPAAAEGRDPEPGLARRSLRDHRLHLPAGPRRPKRSGACPPTQSIIPWIPLMIFAFLFGLSMDYEVFMLTRMREAYDETGDTREAIQLGLARTGKLVTSAALVLMFAFFVLSTSPGTDIKQFGIGLAAGIIFDATVIRALLVPALMMLMGRWNWWLPAWAARPLRTEPSEPVVEARPATEPA